MTLGQLLSTAESQGVITAENRGAVLAAAARGAKDGAMPWYLHAFITIGAWFSSGFFIAFVGAFIGQWFLDQKLAGIVAGLVAIAVAAVIRKVIPNVFVEQVCLSLSVAGHVLFFVGVGGVSLSFGVIVLLSAILSVALYFLYPSPLHRFLSTLTTLILFMIWSGIQQWERGEPTATELYVRQLLAGQVNLILHLAVLMAVFLPVGSRRVSLRPLGYAIAVSLIVLLTWQSAVGAIGFSSRVLVSGYGSMAAVIVCLALASGGLAEIRAHPRVWAVVALALVALAYGKGLPTLVALLFLLLGFRVQERGLQVFGCLLVPAFTFLHYYNLRITLLQKSIHLMASGVVLLLLWLYLSRTRWQSAPPAAQEVAV